MRYKHVLFYIACFVTGCIVAYWLAPTKIITKTIESKEDKETIAELQKQLKQKTKTVRLYQNGIVSSETTETETEQTQTQKTQIVEKIVYKEAEKIVINPKDYILEVGYATNRHYYSHFTIPVWSFINIGIHCDSNFSTSTSAGAGIAIRF